MKLVLLQFISLLLVALPTYADDAAVRKYRDYTPQRLSSLSKEKLKSEVPMMYTMAAKRGLSLGSDLLFGMELNQLMYPGLHDYSSAIKAFQVDLGDKPTGDLTVWQIHQLEQRAEMQKLSRVAFPNQFSSFIADAYAVVEGTMIIVDDRIAWPINHVRVSCSKSENSCALDQLHFVLPDEKSWSQTYQVMQSSTESYEIARWGNDSIESHPLGTSKDCRNTSLSFNFKIKEFYFITRNAGGDCKLMLGGELEKLAKPRAARIVDGEKIIEEKFAEIQKAAYNVVSSAFRKRVEALNQQEQPK
ncbi:MAG: hypothetical protein ACREYF_02885 [Gammaproteobacteria bacterium]